MLKLKNLYYHPSTAEKPVLKNINLKAFFGSPVMISGASGTGKTSLIEVISGLTKPQKGAIYWNGIKINERQRRWLSGVVFQFPERHFLGLSVAQELHLGHRRLSSEYQIKSLKKVGLSDVNLKEAPEKLSGGQQRRLALAVQLLRDPSILLLDEPTAGLDWSVKNEILELLTSIAKEQILIVVTHEPDLFKDIVMDSYHLYKGELHYKK